MKTTGLTFFAVMGLLILGSSVVTSTVFASEDEIDVSMNGGNTERLRLLVTVE